MFTQILPLILECILCIPITVQCNVQLKHSFYGDENVTSSTSSSLCKTVQWPLYTTPETSTPAPTGAAASLFYRKDHLARSPIISSWLSARCIKELPATSGETVSIDTIVAIEMSIWTRRYTRFEHPLPIPCRARQAFVNQWLHYSLYFTLDNHNICARSITQLV